MITIRIHKDCKEYWKAPKEYQHNAGFALSKLKKYLETKYSEGLRFRELFNDKKCVYSIINSEYYVYKYRGPSIQIRFLYQVNIPNNDDLEIIVLRVYHKTQNSKEYRDIFKREFKKK